MSITTLHTVWKFKSRQTLTIFIEGISAKKKIILDIML